MGVLIQPTTTGFQGGSVTTLPAGSSATATPPVVLNNVTPRSNHSLVVVPTSSVSTGIVKWYGSVDGTNYALLGTVDLSSNPGNSQFLVITGEPWVTLYAAITTVIVGGTIQANIASSG
jgi:hypothetical protein